MVGVMKRSFNTPILLITFNRPIHTLRVWNAIKMQHPKNVYIFQDGPRVNNESDIEKCLEVRKIFEVPLDWDCELKTFIFNSNLGCGVGPAKAISWFFDQVDQGIIIEDDAIPGTDFFEYAEELLLLFRENIQVKVIGSVHLGEKKYGEGSYHFSMANRNLCVWATWRRAWNDFDYYLKDISSLELINSLKKYNVSRKEIEYWNEIFHQLKQSDLLESSWDIQFLISIWLKQGIGIFPNVNLSENIGFDAEATHTTQVNNVLANVKTETILPLTHPHFKKVSRIADLNYHRMYFQPYEYGWKGFKRIPYRINKRLKKVLGVNGSWKDLLI